MKEIRQEYFLKTSPPLLFNRLSSASGLSEWFADNVIVEGKIYTFFWGKIEQRAEILRINQNESIRFRWIENNLTTEFEFSIVLDELTGDLALIVTDNIEEEDEEDAIKLWNSQITRLKQIIGS